MPKLPGLGACNNGPKRLDMGGRCLTLGGTGPDKYPEAYGHLAADATAQSPASRAHTRRDPIAYHECVPGETAGSVTSAYPEGPDSLSRAYTRRGSRAHTRRL